MRKSKAELEFNITGSTFLGNSTFNGTQNQDPDGGAVAVYVNQNSKGGVLQGCVFAGNTTASFGGGVYFFTTSSSNGAFLNLKDCTFENNVSVAGGGGAILTFRGNQPNANITDCIFSENTSETGGALILRSDAISSANFLVEDCLIDGNTATHSGGGISLNASSPNYHASISRTTITNNQSPYGGAVDQYHYFSNVPLPLGASVIFDNCLIAGNTSSNASISIGEFPNLTLFNCTVASNTGGGIELSGKSGITLQNTILANPDFPEFAALTNDVAVTSNGGNLVLDNSLNDSLTALDKPETEPDFIPGTFEPSSASPLVNGGVNDNVMAIYDLAGNPRIQNDIVDIGAYESMIIAVRQVVPGRLTLMPNPATDFLNVNLPEGLMGALEVSLYDFHGRLMKQQFAIVNQTIELGSLPPGIYTLKVVSDNQIYAGIFYKQ